MERINLVELLRNCPSGMELDCTIFEGVVFHDVVDRHFPIRVRREQGGLIELTANGCIKDKIDAKCVIFPKGKTTWDGFHRPYINGDIVYTIGDSIAILGDRIGEHSVGFRSYCGLFNYEFDTDVVVSPNRFATEEEKAELFDAIKANGYKWNTETNTLERLIEHKFKVGDKVIPKDFKNKSRVINAILDNEYNLFGGGKIPFSDQDNWELEKLVEPKFKVGDRIILKDNPHNIPSIRIKAVTKSQYILENEGFFYIDSADEKYVLEDKFNINTLVPFESRVLVRSECDNLWRPAIFGFYLDNNYAPYFAVGGTCWEQCIPYEGNEHLRGKIDDCDEFFRTWEKTGN